MKPYLCPVCNGRGSVPPGFYDPSHAYCATGGWETCRACGGKGVIYGFDTGPAERPPNWHKGWEWREISVPYTDTIGKWDDDSYTLTVSDTGDYTIWN